MIWACINSCDHSSKVPSVSNQLAEHHEEVDQFTFPSQTGTIQVSHNEEPVPKNEESIAYEGQLLPNGYAVVDTEAVREFYV